MNKKLLAEKIIEYLGKDNIKQIGHCFTRVRVVLINQDDVQKNEIDKLEGVSGSRFVGDEYQIIIGNDVADLFAELGPLVTVLDNNVSIKKTKNPITRMINVVAGVFTPVLPAIVGAGMLKAIVALLISINLLSPDSGWYQVLNMISDGAFYFLPFLLAVSAAKRFNTNEYLAMSLAAILLYPSFIGQDMGTLINLGFVNIKVIPYSSSVIPIILGTYLLSIVYKYVSKKVPNVLRMVLAPVITLLIVSIITLLILGPLGYMIGEGLQIATSGLFKTAPLLAGLILGGLSGVIVMFGMHYAFIPGTFQSLMTLGYDIFLLPMMLINTLAQSGAAFAVALKTKNKEFRSLAISAGVTSFLGITEPAIFGVNLKHKKPFYASMIGGAVSGGFSAMMAVKMFGFAMPSVISLPLFIEEGTKNLLYIIIAILMSFVISFVLTLVLGFNEEDSDVNEGKILIEKKFNITSPIKGKVKLLNEVNDGVFSNQMLGKGLAIQPDSNEVVAPFDGEVITVLPSNHAIAIKSENGIELLIHIGIETVKLDGKHFSRLVEKGDKFKKGQKLLEFDRKQLLKEGVNLISPVVVTNYSEYTDVIETNEDSLDINDVALLIIK